MRFLKFNGLAFLAALPVVFMQSVLTPAASAQANYTCTNDSPSRCLTVKKNGWVVGEIRAFAFGGDANTAIVKELQVSGWLECEGQSLDTTDFSDLYRAIGTTWGSRDKAQSFLAPDLRGNFLREWNHAGSQKNPDGTVRDPQFSDPGASVRMPPRTAADVGAGQIQGNSGDAVGSMELDQLRAHDHTLAPYKDHSAKTLPGDGLPVAQKLPEEPKIITTQGIINPENGSGAETRPKNAYVMYFIYVGRDVSNIDPVTGKILKGIRKDDTAANFVKDDEAKPAVNKKEKP